MLPYTVVFAEDAQQQLDRLYAYIAKESGDVRADAYIEGIVARCLSLATFPERGTKRDDIRPNLRTMGHERSATIAFSIDRATQAVTIIGVFYGGRNMDAFLGNDENS
jgi:toxin ParE1/3/4